MIAKRWLVAAVALASIGGTAAEAAPRPKPKPKPFTRTYDLTLPVPWVVEDPSGSHCTGAPDGLSKSTQKVGLPTSGKLAVALTGVVGDWIAEVYDPKGRRVGFLSTMSAGTMTVKVKSVSPQTWTIAVCNYAGGPNGVLRLTYTPG